MAPHLPERAIPLTEFDISRLSFTTPKIESFGGTINPCMSTAMYKTPDGAVVSPLLALQETATAGFFIKYKTENDETTPMDSITVQVRFSEGGEPVTPQEKLAVKVFEQIHDLAWKHYADHAHREGTDLPENAVEKLLSNEQRGQHTALKATISHPPFRKEDGETKARPGLDTSRPKMTYMKLSGFKPKDGTGFVSKAQIRGPGGRKVDPVKVATSKERGGRLQPVIQIRGMFFGSHGNTPAQASVQLRLAQANYRAVESDTPFALSTLPAEDGGGNNEDEDESESDYDSDEDDMAGFPSPVATKPVAVSVADQLREIVDDGDDADDLDFVPEDEEDAGAAAPEPPKPAPKPVARIRRTRKKN